LGSFAEKNTSVINSYRMLSLFLMIGVLAITGVALFLYSTSTADRVNVENGNYQTYLIMLYAVSTGVYLFMGLRKKLHFKPESIKSLWYEHSKDEQGRDITDPDLRSGRIINLYLNLELFLLEGPAIIGLTFSIVLSMGGEMPASALDIMFFIPAAYQVFHVLRNRNNMQRIEDIYHEHVLPVVKNLDI